MIIIKSEREISGIRRASEVLIETFEYAGNIVEPGITTEQLDKEIENFILNKGAKPAFKGYRGFPASSCISVNEVVIHGIPDDVKLKEGDIAGIDIGVEYRGYFSDSAFTFPVGDISEETEDLLFVTKKALFNAIEKSVEGNRIGDVSHSIQETAEKSNYNVVREFVGHGVGKHLHEDPPIPNYGKEGRGPRLKEGMTVAIEPMINAGTGQTRVLDDGWTVVTRDKKLSAHYEHTILIGKQKAEVLTISELYKGGINAGS